MKFQFFACPGENSTAASFFHDVSFFVTKIKQCHEYTSSHVKTQARCYHGLFCKIPRDQESRKSDCHWTEFIALFGALCSQLLKFERERDGHLQNMWELASIGDQWPCKHQTFLKSKENSSILDLGTSFILTILSLLSWCYQKLIPLKLLEV